MRKLIFGTIIFSMTIIVVHILRSNENLETNLKTNLDLKRCKP